MSLLHPYRMDTSNQGHPSARQRESLYTEAQAETLNVDLAVNPEKEACKL